MADEAVRSQSRQSQNPRCCRLLRLGKKEWKQQFGELQILFKRIVLWRRQVPWKKIQRCQSRSKHDENSLCCRHFSGASLSERNVLPGTVTNAWRVRNSKAVQHVVGKQSLSVSYTGSLDGWLSIHANDWAAADYEGAWYTDWTSSANWWTAGMERSRFPSWLKARERQRQAVSSGPHEKMSLRATLPKILISNFRPEIDFSHNSSTNFTWQVGNKYEIISEKFNFFKIFLSELLAFQNVLKTWR